MPAEVWQMLKSESESITGKEVKFPNNWESDADLFYLKSIWVDGLPEVDYPIEITLTVDGTVGVVSNAVAYSFLYFGGLQELPNPWVMAEDYAFIDIRGTTAVLRISLFGERRTGKNNPDLALVAFGKAIYDTAPTS